MDILKVSLARLTLYGPNSFFSNSENALGLPYFDFSRAFEKIPHAILIRKSDYKKSSLHVFQLLKI